MRYYIITILAILTLSVGSASCSEDEPIQGTGQQVIPGKALVIMAVIIVVINTGDNRR